MLQKRIKSPECGKRRNKYRVLPTVREGGPIIYHAPIPTPERRVQKNQGGKLLGLNARILY